MISKKKERKTQTQQKSISNVKKCKFTADTIYLLDEHMREKHRIFKCDQCNFTSSSEVGLKIHKTKSHSLIDLPEIETEKEALPIQIKCDQCDLYFKDESDLTTHFGDMHCEFCVFISKSKQG